jgi:hypothetical protein
VFVAEALVQLMHVDGELSRGAHCSRTSSG